MSLSHEERTKIRHLKAARTTPKYRTFINISDGHNKFWKIARLDETVYTQWGPIDGAIATVTNTPFDSVQDAERYRQRKITEKLGSKGYEEI